MAPCCVLLYALQWPGCLDAVKPPNAGLKLFGGAAFERCLNEFQVAANTLAFPSCERLRCRAQRRVRPRDNSLQCCMCCQA